MEYIHETLQVHASHWDDVSWTRKTTLAFFVFELSCLDLVPYSKLCPGLNNNFMVYLLQLHINPFFWMAFGGGIHVLWTLFLVFAKFIQFSATGMSGKFEFVSGKCWGIVREFWSVLNVWILLLSALYLVIEWTDFSQTYTNISLGGGKTLIRFWWPWPHFQGHRRA